MTSFVHSPRLDAIATALVGEGEEFGGAVAQAEIVGGFLFRHEDGPRVCASVSAAVRFAACRPLELRRANPGEVSKAIG